jgi:hypothetical protein
MTDDPAPAPTPFAAVAEELRRWRAAHPEATLYDIETTLDARLRGARAGLLAELAADGPEDPACCPECGGPLARRGARTRALRTAGDVPLALSRSYRVCPACGAGLFPPR